MEVLAHPPLPDTAHPAVRVLRAALDPNFSILKIYFKKNEEGIKLASLPLGDARSKFKKKPK